MWDVWQTSGCDVQSAELQRRDVPFAYLANDRTRTRSQQAAAYREVLPAPCSSGKDPGLRLSEGDSTQNGWSVNGTITALTTTTIVTTSITTVIAVVHDDGNRGVPN
jgi:hypothetical protein